MMPRRPRYLADTRRERYFRDLERGEWYDNHNAFSHYYNRWTDDMRAHDAWNRRFDSFRTNYDPYASYPSYQYDYWR